MAFLYAISIAAELSVHGMRAQTHAGALRSRQGLWSQDSGAAISPASLGQECSLQGETHTEILARVWMRLAFILCRMQWPRASLGAEKEDGVILHGPLLQCHQGHIWNKTWFLTLGQVGIWLKHQVHRNQTGRGRSHREWDLNAQDPGCVVVSATVSSVLTPVQEALTYNSSGQWEHLSFPKQGLGESRKGVHSLSQGLRIMGELPGSQGS